MAPSLPYHEPGIVTILTQASFLLLLNVGNSILDHVLYCGLLGQVFLGVAWGTPGAKWLGAEAEHIIVQLGYLGLLLLVYEGGLATSFRSLKANFWMSLGVAVTGIALPMALSFTLRGITGATHLQSFAAGAALCSTSLGTTFTVLGSSGLMSSRLAVVLTSAAMMDDVVGLVMVQIISNMGRSDSSISAITIVRPLLVSFAFAVGAPIACWFIVRPMTLRLNEHRTAAPTGEVNRLLTKCNTTWLIHTLVMLSLIAGSTYAGTSNLFASYIAGACISWWDTEVPHPVVEDSPPSSQPTQTGESSPDGPRNAPKAKSYNTREASFTGSYTFEKYYKQPLERILRPFFFASIGFSIPITEMFKGSIIWKGVVYAILMAFGKMACGLWLFPIPRNTVNPLRLLTSLKRRVVQLIKTAGTKPTPCSNRTTVAERPATSEATTSTPSQRTPSKRGTTTSANTAEVKPRSLYPASILGCAMTARGEIGFLISSIAESNGIFSTSQETSKSSDNFLVVTWAIMICTILGPLAVGILVRRVRRLQQGVESQGQLIRRDVLGDWALS